MSAISDFLEPLMINGVFNQTVVGTFATHVALFTTATTDAGGGTEVSGSAYARVLVNISGGGAPEWNLAVVDGTTFLVDNQDVITFPAASGGNWGTISHVAIYDALTVGNSLWHGPLDTPIVVNDGTTFSFPAGNLNMTLD